MAVQDFSYESVFRYLRCGMSCVTREEADLLENYVLALGIRGFKKWDEVWVRIYRGMPPENIQRLNEIRERFADETRELALSFKGGRRRYGNTVPFSMSLPEEPGAAETETSGTEI